MKKLAISAPKDEEIWDYNTSFVCLACSSAGQEITTQEPKLDEMKIGIMTALSSAQQSEIKAWEEEIVPCEHTLTLQQEPVVVPGNGNYLLCITLYNNMDWLIYLNSSITMFLLRSYFQSVVVSHLRSCQLWSATIRRDWW